jgi:PAS domain S-box-containing protein
MNKYVRILKSFNISAFFMCVFFAVFLLSAVEYSRHHWIFIIAALLFCVNMWLVKKQWYGFAYTVFMGVTCMLLLVFDAGLMSPTKSYVFYIPLLMSSFIVVDPKQRILKYGALVFTIFCIISTSFFEYTPRLALLLLKPEHQQVISYFNIFSAVTMTVLMMEIVIRSNNDAEDVIRMQEKNVRTKDLLIKSIAQNIDVGICRTDVASDRLVYVNRAQVGMFGYDSEEELLRIAPGDLYASTEERQKVIELLETQGQALNMETRFRRKDGSLFWGQLSSIRVVDDAGNVMYDGGLRDITMMKELKQQLIEAKNQAEQASVAKSRFLSTMSHEIRTPMNAVIGITNLMLMKEREDEEESNNLRVLKSSAESLMSLLNNLLDFSKIEAGKIDLYQRYCNLEVLMRQVLDVYAFLAREKGIELVSVIDIGDDLYEADGARISQVLGNLLSNAVKFTQQGYVRFTATREDVDAQTSRICFSIQDTGIGIEQSEQKHIFNVFTQENPAISRQFGGSGLGLAISNNILKKMNSSISVSSVKHEGSVFSFAIELKHKPAVAKEDHQRQAEEKVPLRGMRILLAEDNLVNITVARQLLLRWQISLSIAKNGLEVLDMLKEGSYDLILMDLHMPEMDGITATARLRGFGHTLPIIALTADAQADTKDQAIRSGMNDFITKPFNPEDLYNKLCNYA